MRTEVIGRRTIGAAAFLAALLLAASLSPASASVLIGQVGAPTAADACDISDNLQPTVTSGTSYVVPAVGTITSWSHSARSGTLGGPVAKMKVFRPLGGPTYQVVGGDGPRPLSPGLLNTFATSVSVVPGDVIGLWVPMRPADDAIGCSFSVPGDSFLRRSGDLADGQSGAFAANASTLNRRVNVAAVLSPLNSFNLGSIKRNKRKGTATLRTIVPNPGELTGSGKGVKVANAAVSSRTVSAPGPVTLTIRATGKKKRKLNETGKVKVKPKITYTPTGGDPATQSPNVKLQKKL